VLLFKKGIGIGCLGCVFSDIVKTTEVNERTTRLSRVMIGRQIGLIIGPSFNLIALNFNYQIGPFLLDNLSAPGVISCFTIMFELYLMCSCI